MRSDQIQVSMDWNNINAIFLERLPTAGYWTNHIRNKQQRQRQARENACEEATNAFNFNIILESGTCFSQSQRVVIWNQRQLKTVLMLVFKRLWLVDVVLIHHLQANSQELFLSFSGAESNSCSHSYSVVRWCHLSHVWAMPNAPQVLFLILSGVDLWSVVRFLFTDHDCAW